MLIYQKIVDFRVPADQPAPDSPVHTASSPCVKLLPQSRHISAIDISTNRREAPAMAPQVMIGEPDVQSAALSFGMYVAWAHYSRLNIT